MKKYFKILFLIFFTKASFGQSSKMEILNNKLLCNVFTYGNADSATKRFLKNHFPNLVGQKPVGIVFTPPVGSTSKKGIVPMKFNKHPFFDFNIVRGQLNFKTIKNPGEPPFEVGADLQLFFANRQSADSAYLQLLELFKKVATKQNLVDNKDKKTAEFAEVGAKYTLANAFIQLRKNRTQEYEIYFHE